MLIFHALKKFLKPKKIDFEPRLKMKGKSKTGRKEARKKSVKNANMKVCSVVYVLKIIDLKFRYFIL